MQQALELEAGRRGLALDALSVDILFGDVCDLTDPGRIAQWRSWCRDGTISAVIGGPPCESWSRARGRGDGPGHLRSVSDLWGLPHLHGEVASKVEAANSLLLAALLLATDLLTAGGVAIIEHPATFWHERLPSIWRLAPVRALLAAEECQLVRLDQCQVGSGARAPTFLLAVRCPSLPGRVAALPGGGCCTHGPGAHRPLIGRDASGAWLTASKRAYPDGLCSLLAAAALDDLAPRGRAEARGGEGDGELELELGPLPAELRELLLAPGAAEGAATTEEEGWRDLDSTTLRRGRAKDALRRTRRAEALAAAAAGDVLVARAIATAGAGARD